MNSSIEQRAMKNSLVGTLSFVLILAQNLVSVPVLLYYWGNEKYGLWIALFAGVSILQSIDSGHQNYVGNKFNLLYHKCRDELMEVLGSSILIAYFLGFLEIVLCGLLILSGYLPGFLGITPELALYYQTSIGLITLMLMWFLSGSVGGILVRLLIPVGMMYESIWWGIIIRAAQFLSLMGVVVLGGSILTACVVFALVQAFISGLMFLYIKKKIPEFYPWWQKRSWRTAFGNFRKSIILTINGIAQQLSNNGLIIFIAMLFQTAAVPGFATVRTLTNTARGVTNIFVSSLLPDIVRFHAKEEARKLITTLKANWFFNGLFVNLGIVIVLPFIESLYMFWTKGCLEFNFSLFLFLAASISFVNFGAGLSIYLVGINNLVSQTSITLTRVLIIFVVALLFAKCMGLAGIGVGILASEIVCSFFLPLYFVNIQLHKFGAALSLKTIVIAVAPPVIISLIAVVYFLTNSINILILVASILLSIIYMIEWKELDEEVKNRFRQLITTFRSTFFRSHE